MDPAHGPDPLLERIVLGGLGGDRRGLGHPVTDRHPRHVHLGHDPSHHLDRAGRTGHDPGPQGREVVLLEARVIEHRDEHRRYAVERRAALLRRGGQGGLRVEGLAGHDDAGAVAGTGEVAEDHPEAVVEGHRDADPVGLLVAAARAGEPAVVEDVAVAQGRALRRPGRPAGELDVDRVPRVDACRPRREFPVRDSVAGGEQLRPIGRVEPGDQL